VRIAIYAVILLVVCALVGSLYVRYDTKRFMDDFEKRHVTPVSEQTLTDNNSEISQVESGNPEQDQQSEQIEEPDEYVSESVQGDNTKDLETFEIPGQSDSLYDTSPFTLLEQEADETEESEQQETDVNDLSLEQIIANNRKHLIAEHGDIPEVHTYLKYFPFEALLDGNKGKEYTLDLSLEEHLNYHKAVAYLFPNKANRDKYLDAKKMYEKFKSDDQGY